MSRADAVEALFDWLLDGARGAAGAPGVVERLGVDLRAAGVPVERVAAFVTTLHPSVLGRSFRWSPEEGIEVGELPHGSFGSDRFTNSPVNDILRSRREVRARLDQPAEAKRYPVFEELAAKGFTDYLGLPLLFSSDEVHCITYTTKEPGGFSDAHVVDLRRVTRPLARVGEILALRRVASTLLTTYVGHNSGDRIFAGQIQKGDFETIRAVIWFSDLRGFTEMSSRLTTREVIDNLNRVFECQVPAIEKKGGEVLKFMGDGLLAIFPLGPTDDVAQVADRALLAADEALAAIEALAPLRIGIALHVGELAYGNIGSSNRLDFTAIGPAVNLAARLEGLTSKLGEPLVVSEDMARITSRATDDLGAFELKGVPGAVHVHAPR